MAASSRRRTYASDQQLEATPSGERNGSLARRDRVPVCFGSRPTRQRGRQKARQRGRIVQGIGLGSSSTVPREPGP